MKLDVGDIIYIIDPRTKSVVPARVNEQIVSKSLEGEKITHNLELPNGKEVSLETLDASFFKSLDDVREHLLKKAVNLIEIGVKNAAEVAKEKFALSSPEDPLGGILGPESLVTPSENMEDVHVVLENGQKVKVNLPPEFTNENPDH